MKRFEIKAAILILLILCMFIPNQEVSGAVSSWTRSVSIYPRSADEFGSDKFDQVLSQIVADNANTIILVIPYYQRNQHVTEIVAGADTPTDESVVRAIEMAHAKNLDVMLKVHIDTRNGIWRAEINPSNRDAWYRNYENLMLHYAAIGQIYGAEHLCLGTELIRMAAANMNSDNTARWKKMISNIRKIYQGKLTYSANWGPASSSFANEKDHIEFWSDLDYIGLSAYYPLVTRDNFVETLTSAWNPWYLSDIKPLALRNEKSVHFLEIGYRSLTNSRIKPYDFQSRGAYDPVEQVNAYEAMFAFWSDKPEIGGVGIWDFYADPAAGGPGDIDFTPQNKPAEEVIRRWFLPEPEVVEAAEPPVARRRSFLDRIRDIGGVIQTILEFSLVNIEAFA